jgi:transcriptional regulator with XRE-family HTH domain
MITLQKWLEDNQMTVVAFADGVGLDHSTIYRIMSGERMPSLEVAHVIQYATGGDVKTDTFLKMPVADYMKRYRDEARESANKERRTRAMALQLAEEARAKTRARRAAARARRAA